MNLAANNGGLVLGNTALAQRFKQQCPCAIAGSTMLSQQVLKDCPCASSVAAAVTKALHDALMTSSANNYAYDPPAQNDRTYTGMRMEINVHDQ